MSHLTHVVPGEPFKPAAGDWNAFVDTARTVRDQRVIFKPGEIIPSADEPVLFVALSDWDKVSSDGAEYCVGSSDGYVGRAARLELQEDWREHNFYNRKNYNRIDGEAHCIWAPAETACVGNLFKIKCGQTFWAKWNNGRWEAISSGRRLEDGSLETCECTRFGFAIWKIGYDESDAPIWELDENRCSGCYSATEGRPTIPADYRFSPTELNDDWLSEPAADPADFDPLTTDFTDQFRYVTCCNVADVYDPPCDLTCCYSVSGIPTPVCEGDTPGTHSRHLGNVAACAWESDDAGSQIFRLISEDNGTCDNTENFTVGEGITMSTGQIVVRWVISGSGVSSFGRVVTGVYSLSDIPDCVSSLTANLTNVFATGDSIPGDCQSCGLTNGYFEGLFPSTLSISVTSCGTTTSTTTGSTTTASTTSTTTASTTTSSTTTASTTTGSTTTSSTTTGSTTTGSTTTDSTTTGSTSSTTAACTGSCVYTSWAVGTGSPTGWYWLLASSTCSMGCGCPADDAAEAAAIGRWPVDGSDNATISCA